MSDKKEVEAKRKEDEEARAKAEAEVAEKAKEENLEDDIAKDGVIYLYKTTKGATRAIPLFSIPSMAEKLSVMGPGEVFVDTRLSELAEEIRQINGDK